MLLFCFAIRPKTIVKKPPTRASKKIEIAVPAGAALLLTYHYCEYSVCLQEVFDSTRVIDSEITNAFSNWFTSASTLSWAMSVLSYLKRAFPSVEPPAVVDALLTPECVTFCEAGRFIAIRLEGNKQIKIPSDMGKGCPVNLADRILLEWGIQIGGSWAKTHAYKGPQHKRVAERFLNRLSPPPVLEQLFTVRL